MKGRQEEGKKRRKEEKKKVRGGELKKTKKKEETNGMTGPPHSMGHAQVNRNGTAYPWTESKEERRDGRPWGEKKWKTKQRKGYE